MQHPRTIGLCFCLFLLPCWAIGQGTTPPLSIGFEAGAGLSGQWYAPADRGTFEGVPGLSASVGVHLHFHFTERLSIHSGAHMYLHHFGQRDYTPRFACDFDQGEVNPRGSWLHTRSRLSYVGLPFALRWRMASGPRSPYLMVGSNLLFFTFDWGDSEIYECGKPGISFDGVRFPLEASLLTTVQAGVGYEYRYDEGPHTYFELRMGTSIERVFLDHFIPFPTGFVPAGGRLWGVQVVVGQRIGLGGR